MGLELENLLQYFCSLLYIHGVEYKLVIKFHGCYTGNNNRQGNTKHDIEMTVIQYK